MQSLQIQFLKLVAVKVVCTYHCTLRKDYNMYPQPPPFNYLQMENETTDYCSQNFFENQSLTSHRSAAWLMGNGIALVFIRNIMAISIDRCVLISQRQNLHWAFSALLLHFSNPWLKTVHPFTFFET